MTFAHLEVDPMGAITAAMNGEVDGISVRTSGSSGEPRAVLLQTKALRAAAAACHARVGGPGHWVLALPPDRIGGAMVMVRSLVAGTELVAMRPGPFTAEAFADATEAAHPQGPLYTSLVPTQLHRLLAADVGRQALQRYQAVLVGGAPLHEPEVPSHVISTYGMTETAGGCVYDGVPLDGVQVRTDADHHISIAGPMLAAGHDAGHHGEFTQEGDKRWFRTSDLGRVHGGRLEVWGRADDVIITGGHKVHPGSVDSALERLPEVASAVSCGVPDPEWGERIVAVIELEAGAAMPALPRLRDSLRSTLAAHELPHDVHPVAHLPRLESGKVDRAAARALASTRPSSQEAS